MRIDDQISDEVQRDSDRRAQEGRRTQVRREVTFKAAMQHAAELPQLGDERAEQRNRLRNRKDPQQNILKRNDNADHNKSIVESILGQWHKEGDTHIERQVQDKRIRRIAERSLEESDIDDQEYDADEFGMTESAKNSHHELESAVVGGFSSQGQGEGGAGAEGEGGGQERDASDRDGPEFYDRVNEELGEEASLQVRGNIAVHGKRRIGAVAPNKHLDFSLSFKDRAYRAIPQSLVRQIVSKCELALQDLGTVVELTLSRHLFEGMQIRISTDKQKGSAGPLKIEFVTESAKVAAFFESKRDEIADTLSKRGLAVARDRVIVQLVTSA